MKINEEQNFETAYENLKALKKIIDNPETSLEALVEAYEGAAEQYQACMKALNDAKQRVTIVKEQVDKVMQSEDN